MSFESSSLCAFKPFLIVSSFFLASTIDSILTSSLIPLLPERGKVLGFSESWTTFLFSALPVGVLLSTPSFACASKWIGSQRMLCLGPVITAGACMAFVFFSNYYFMYTVLLIQGIGSAMFWIAAFSLVQLLFPLNTGVVIALIEIGQGVGFVAGPAISLLLYSVGGFLLPFWFCGGLMLLSALIFFFLDSEYMECPKDNLERDDENETEEASSLNYKTLINRNLFVCTAILFVVEVACNALTPHLTTHLQADFGYSLTKVGTALAIGSGAYMLVCAIVGKVSQKYRAFSVLILGALVTGTGFLCFSIPSNAGPKTINSGWLPILSLILISAGQGLTYVPALPALLESISHTGAKDPEKNRSMSLTEAEIQEYTPILSGSFHSLSTLAAAVGPILGQFFVSFIHFYWTAFVLGVSLFALGLVVAFTMTEFLSFSHLPSLCSDYEPIPDVDLSDDSQAIIV